MKLTFVPGSTPDERVAKDEQGRDFGCLTKTERRDVWAFRYGDHTVFVGGPTLSAVEQKLCDHFGPGDHGVPVEVIREHIATQTYALVGLADSSNLQHFLSVNFVDAIAALVLKYGDEKGDEKALQDFADYLRVELRKGREALKTITDLNEFIARAAAGVEQEEPKPPLH